MFQFFLQADTTAVAAQVAGVQEESMFSLLMRGGPLMIPLFLLFAAAIFFFFERLLVIRKASRQGENFMNQIKDLVVNGNIAGARSLARSAENPVARIIEKGIQRIGKPIDVIEKSMDNVGKVEIYKMEKNLGVLAIIARIAPLFGFVGTIIGLVMLLKDFANIANPSISQIADAMYVKLITSATGLIIGMLAYLGYSYLDTQISKTANKMEIASNDFIDLLQEPAR